jgi:hypothetical protein
VGGRDLAGGHLDSPAGVLILAAIGVLVIASDEQLRITLILKESFCASGGERFTRGVSFQ